VVCQWSLQIILLQRHNKFYRVVFSLRQAIKDSSEQVRQLSPLMQMNIHPTIGWRHDEHRTHKHTHSSWILNHIFTWKQCILCSELHHKCCLTLLYAGTIVHSSIRLLPRSLVSSQGCSLAITFTNMAEVPISNLSDHSCICGHLIPLRFLSQRVLCRLFQPLLPPPVQT